MNNREMIRMINDNTCEMLEKFFDSPADADDFEFILDTMQVHYQRWSNSEMLYEVNERK